MKRSFLRILCAFLLMGVALAVTIGIFAAKKEETVFVWQSVTVEAPQAVCLYDEAGTLVQTLDSGATSKLLPTGRYYAVSGELCAQFAIENDGIIVHSGGWTDGRVLHLTDEKVGTICVEFAARDAFYPFVLQGAGETRREIVRGSEGQTGRCEFFGLPFGGYVLYLGEEKISSVRISENTPTVIVAIP